MEEFKRNNSSFLQTTDGNHHFVELKLQGTEIILTRKSEYRCTPQILQTWLAKFGIVVSITTTTFLMEFGMPYGGEIVSLTEILRYTNRGCGVIGILAFQLSVLINSKDAGININQSNHPLLQSVVLGLARLEEWLNPEIFSH